MFHIYYNPTEQKYKMRDNSQIDCAFTTLATFKVFDMAYQYLITLNGMSMVNNYSRWMQR